MPASTTLWLSVCPSVCIHKNQLRQSDVSDSQSSKVPLNDIVASAQATHPTLPLPHPPGDTEYPNTSSEPYPMCPTPPELKHLPKYFQCLTLDGFTSVTVFECNCVCVCVWECLAVCLCVCECLVLCAVCGMKIDSLMYFRLHQTAACAD